MTTDTQITVAFYNPRKGNIPASIKTTDNNYYGVEDNTHWNTGSTYAIEYTERAGTGKWQGRTFRDIKSAQLVHGQPTENTSTNGGGAGISHNNSHNQFRNPEQMFVEALLVKAVEEQTIHFTEESLMQSALMLQKVWQRLWGGQ